MEATDDTELVKIRVLANAIATEDYHVDYQDAAHDNQTLLMKLCYLEPEEEDLLEMLDKIMAGNLSVNVRDTYGRTALIHACISQNYTVADSLLYYDDTLIDAMDKESCTALTYAIRLKDSLMVEKVMSHPKSRTSNLLKTQTNGKTPLELATLIGNDEITNILKTMLRCSSSAIDPRERIVSSTKPQPSLPEVRVSRPLASAFMATKSHSDPLLLPTKKETKSLFSQDLSLPFSGDIRFNDRPIASSSVNSTDEWEGTVLQAREINQGQTPAKYTETLPALYPSAQRRSGRRGSVSLPDLTSLPPGLTNVNLDSSDSETEENDSGQSDDSQVDIDEYEDRRLRNAANRRKNSMSLPDLCFTQFPNFGSKTNSSDKIGVSDHRLVGEIGRSTNQIFRYTQCREKSNELKLPDIHMCQSPSLPALDRMSLMKMNLITPKSVHDLNSSVRRPIDGEKENLRKRLIRHKEKTIMQSMS